MRLLQTEVDVVPGRKPQKQPLPEGFVGQGTATLRIQNTTPRQNSYTIRVKCEDAYWQDAWYTLAALPPTGDPQNNPPTGKPDQAGPKNQSLTVFIKDGGTRDVIVSFVVPEKSECRAGIYRAKIIVETRIISEDPIAARRERITEIPITIIVRPFYEWKINYTPEERRVGLFRRKSQFELVVENHGNDWLYLDLKLPRPQNVLVETPVQTIAVPPPEPGTDSVRTIPIGALSRFRNIRGSKVPTPLPLQVQRLDAPTIPALPEEAAFGPCAANTGAAVVAGETNETGVPEVPAKLIYSPPIPDTLQAFFEAIGRNARGLVFFFIGFFIAWQMISFTYEMYFRDLSDFRVLRSTVKINEPLGVKGKYIAESRVFLYDAVTKQPLGDPINTETKRISPTSFAYFVTIKDQTLDGKKVVMGVQRLGKMTLLNRFLPIIKDPTSVQIGKAPEAPKAAGIGSLPGTISPGKDFVIGGTNFGPAPGGKVLVDAKPATVANWSEEQITVKAPKGLVPGNPATVRAFSADGKPIDLGPGQVFVADVEMPPGGFEGMTGGEEGGTTGTPGGTTGSPGGTTGTPGGTTGTTGSTPPPPTAGALPSTFSLLVSDSRNDYTKVVQTTGEKTVGELAVKAFAFAELNRADEAQARINKAMKMAGSRESGKDIALLLLASAKTVETATPSKADEYYAGLDADIDGIAPGFVFKDIAIARYKISSGSKFEAEILLKDALKKNPTPAETREINRLLKLAGR
jgi:hypothetical protein